MDHVINEVRMVLPGVQTLFGFQLIVTFNTYFREVLSAGEQRAHLLATAMSAVAIALLMGPAAYHRQVHPRSISKSQLKLSSWLLTLSLVPLVIALCIDFYLVARVILDHKTTAGLLTGLLTTVFVFLWFILPRYKRYERKGEVF